MRQRETEKWVAVPRLNNLTEELNDEWQNKYMVSSLGNIYSNVSNKKLRPSINKKGYHLLSTKLGGRTGNQGTGKNLCVRVHRLVAMAFLPNHENKSEVNHKNGDKDNNTMYNLEWATPSENALHSVHVLGNRSKRGIENPLHVVTKEQREYVKSNYKPRHKLFGARALGRELGVHHVTILRVLAETDEVCIGD